MAWYTAFICPPGVLETGDGRDNCIEIDIEAASLDMAYQVANAIQQELKIVVEPLDA